MNHVRFSIVTIKAGAGLLPAGAAIGRLRTGAVSVVAGRNSGNGKLALDPARPLAALAVAGDYAVECVSAAPVRFRVSDPHGLPSMVALGEAHEGGVRFTVAEGDEPFAPGDSFIVTVPDLSPHWSLSPAQALTDLDGAEIAAAVTLAPCDATEAVAQVIAASAGAEWAASDLVFHPSVNTEAEIAEKILQLGWAGVRVTSPPA